MAKQFTITFFKKNPPKQAKFPFWGNLPIWAETECAGAQQFVNPGKRTKKKHSKANQLANPRKHLMGHTNLLTLKYTCWSTSTCQPHKKTAKVWYLIIY